MNGLQLQRNFNNGTSERAHIGNLSKLSILLYIRVSSTSNIAEILTMKKVLETLHYQPCFVSICHENKIHSHMLEEHFLRALMRQKWN